MRSLCLLPGLLSLVALAGAVATQPLTLTTVRVAAGLTNPCWCGSPPLDEARLFVVEQTTARIRIVKGGAVLATPFLTVSGVLSGGERGLLGMAFHPDYLANGYFYVNYTRSTDGATMVERFTVLGSPATSDIADPASRYTILGPIAQPFANHNGGNLVFGPDRYLYIGLGDGGSSGDPSCNAQNRLQLLGKMLRIDVNGAQPYSIPTTNPFAGNAAYRPEIWALGLRNPWRYSFDRITGDLYIGDVGQNAIEEINFQPGNSAGGENYGWKIMEGKTCYSTASCLTYAPACNAPALTLPIHTYDHTLGCSITGGGVYRGCGIPHLHGTYFFADYCNNTIWSFRYSGGAMTEFTNRTTELAPGGGLTINSPVHFGEDARGEIHIVDLGGEIFKIVPRLPAAGTDIGSGLVGSNGLQPAFEACGLLNTGNLAIFRLRYGQPGQSAILCASLTNNPIPFLGGTLVPSLPPALAVGFVLDAQGTALFVANGGNGPFDVFAQFVLSDPGLPQLVGFSNALRISVLP